MQCHDAPALGDAACKDLKKKPFSYLRGVAFGGSCAWINTFTSPNNNTVSERGVKFAYRVGSRSRDANQEDRDSSFHAARTWLTLRRLQASFNSDNLYSAASTVRGINSLQSADELIQQPYEPWMTNSFLFRH